MEKFLSISVKHGFIFDSLSSLYNWQGASALCVLLRCSLPFSPNGFLVHIRPNTIGEWGRSHTSCTESEDTTEKQ